MKHSILFIDDNESLRESMSVFFEREGFNSKCAADGEGGIALVRQNVSHFSIALVDYHLPDMNGAQVTARIRELDSDIIILGFSDDKTDPVHNEALAAGALIFVNKDASDAKLLGILHRHCQEYERRNKPLTITTRSANQKLISALGMVGCSNHLAQISRDVFKYALTTSTVFIRGENGTGKEMIARAVHNLSDRRNMPFIPVNCATISKDLIAKELFGHVKGAFTGAVENSSGKFQAANHGTIFLDEIGELSSDAQAALLRVLQDKTLMPVGSNKTQTVDVRVVTATNAPIEKMIEANEFRIDLFQRLNVLPIRLNPLRERPEDIPYLVEHFMGQENKKGSAKKMILESDVEKLKALPWLGNVRELGHAIEYLFTVCDGDRLDISRLKNWNDNLSKQRSLSSPGDIRNLGATIKEREVEEIKSSLRNQGSVVGAARRLGISRGALRAKIEKYGIEIEKFTKEKLRP